MIGGLQPTRTNVTLLIDWKSKDTMAGYHAAKLTHPPKDILHVQSHIAEQIPYNFAFAAVSSFSACSFKTLLKIFPLTLLGMTSTKRTPPRSFL